MSKAAPRIVAAEFEKELLGQLWEGRVNAAIELLKGTLGVGGEPHGGRGADPVPGEPASVHP